MTYLTQDQAEELVRARLQGSPAPGGGRITDVVIWGIEGEWFRRDGALDLMIYWTDRHGALAKEQNPPWCPPVTTEELRAWSCEANGCDPGALVLWLEG